MFDVIIQSVGLESNFHCYCQALYIRHIVSLRVKREVKLLL